MNDKARVKKEHTVVTNNNQTPTHTIQCIHSYQLVSENNTITHCNNINE